jgi:hypothetical protein
VRDIDREEVVEEAPTSEDSRITAGKVVHSRLGVNRTNHWSRLLTGKEV